MTQEIWYAILATNRGMWGGMRSICKGADGKPILYETREEACAEHRRIEDNASPINNFTSYGIIAVDRYGNRID
jgi:hypothetical protein